MGALGCYSAEDSDGDSVACNDPTAVVCYDFDGDPVSCSAAASAPPTVAATTVSANPAVPNTSSGSSASQLSQLGNTLGQWGATIAAIATGTPTVVTATGAKVGTPAIAPIASNTSMILLLVVGLVIVLVVMEK
jgi:hypothetical protein